MQGSKKQLVYLIIIFLTVLDLVLMGYATFYSTSRTFKFGVIVFDLILCILMWIEFIYSYLHSENKKQYLKENSLSILGMLPIDIVFFRALRLVKLIQLIKLFVLARETTGNLSKFLKHTYLDKIILISIIFSVFLTVLIRIVDSNINNLQTAFWYIVVTITSTGYGDVVPATASGRLIGIVAMIGGILIFSTITAVISSLYMSKISKANRDDLESKIEDLSEEIKKLNKKIDDL